MDPHEKFTALHEGLQPEEDIDELIYPASGDRKLGRAIEIQYLKKIPDDVPSYHHPFAAQAQPTIACGRDGKDLVIFAGKYETTRRGIEDRVTRGMPTVEYLKQPYVQREELPGRATELITLGTLEWIRYKDRTGRTKKLEFSPEIAPEIAHDQQGDLHVLHGRYLITQTGIVEKDSRINPAGASMKRAHRSKSSRRSRSRARHSRRYNPAQIVSYSGETSMQRAGRMVMNSVVVGGVGTVTAVALNLGIQKFWPLWSPVAKAATKIVAGLAGGIGFAYLLPGTPAVAAGVSVGGVIDGFLDLYNLYVAPRLASMTTPAVTTTTTTSTLPAGQAFGQPLPRQYAGYSPAACGVPAR